METEEVAQNACRITITAAGKECLVFRALLQQVLPVLRRPERFNQAERCHLVQNIAFALEKDFDVEEEAPDGEAETEALW